MAKKGPKVEGRIEWAREGDSLYVKERSPGPSLLKPDKKELSEPNGEEGAHESEAKYVQKKTRGTRRELRDDVVKKTYRRRPRKATQCLQPTVRPTGR